MQRAIQSYIEHNIGVHMLYTTKCVRILVSIANNATIVRRTCKMISTSSNRVIHRTYKISESTQTSKRSNSQIICSYAMQKCPHATTYSVTTMYNRVTFSTICGRMQACKHRRLGYSVCRQTPTDTAWSVPRCL